MDLKVEEGIEGWFRSGPLYIPIWIFFWATPTTRNTDWLIWTVRPTTSSLPKRSRGQLLPQEDDASLLGHVARVHESAPGLRVDVPHLSELGLDTAQPRVDGLRSHGDGHELRVFDRQQRDFGDARAQERGVLLLERDGPAGGQAHPGSRRGPRPHDGDALAHPPRPLGERSLEALAEGEEEDDREGAPGDGEDGEDDPLRLVAEVGAEEAPDQGELGDREPHESLSATTGSRSDARRAGK